MKKYLSLQAWLNHLPKQTRLILLTVAYGCGAGLIAVAFQVLMNGIYRLGLGALAHQSPTTFALGSFGLMVGAALVVGWMLHKLCRAAAGSGIPQLKAAFWKDFGFVPIRIIWVKFLAGALQIGAGSSLGREGPTVQLAGAVGSNLAGIAGESKQRRRHGAATGAAAGLAAAFNTPLAAVTFVLEEIIGDLNSRLLGSILLAAMVGALVTHGLLGPQPAFTLATIGEPGWRAYLIVPIVAAVAALVGVAFQKSALGLRQTSRGFRFIPFWAQPALGAVFCWALGLVVFLKTGRLGVFGLGYEDLSDALAGNVGWQIAALLLLTKFFATVACYGLGGCGGIFSPTLFFGAMAGLAVAGAAQLIMPLHGSDLAMLAVIGMSATLGAVVRAPVTSILIVFEMTHEFALVPPLMLGAIVSQAISRRLLHHNFYDALLEQDGHDLDRFTPPRDLPAWHRQPVSALANPRPIVLESLETGIVKKFLDKHPYQAFPVIQNGAFAGLLWRDTAETALKQGSAPPLRPAAVCQPDEPLKQAELRMIEQGATVAVVIPAGEKKITGILTLHDLLRAGLAASERSDEGDK